MPGLSYPSYPGVGRGRSRPNGRLHCFWQFSYPIGSHVVHPHSRYFPSFCGKPGKGRICQLPLHIHESQELRKQIAFPVGARSGR